MERDSHHFSVSLLRSFFSFNYRLLFFITFHERLYVFVAVTKFLSTRSDHPSHKLKTRAKRDTLRGRYTETKNCYVGLNRYRKKHFFINISWKTLSNIILKLFDLLMTRNCPWCLSISISLVNFVMCEMRTRKKNNEFARFFYCRIRR